jgi:hypothetical protein
MFKFNKLFKKLIVHFQQLFDKFFLINPIIANFELH